MTLRIKSKYLIACWDMSHPPLLPNHRPSPLVLSAPLPSSKGRIPPTRAFINAEVLAPSPFYLVPADCKHHFLRKSFPPTPQHSHNVVFPPCTPPPTRSDPLVIHVPRAPYDFSSRPVYMFKLYVCVIFFFFFTSLFLSDHQLQGQSRRQSLELF